MPTAERVNSMSLLRGTDQASAEAHLEVKVVGEEHEDFWGADADVGVQEVGAHLDGVPLPKQVRINLHPM